jgi:hypothetical protein
MAKKTSRTNPAAAPTTGARSKTAKTKGAAGLKKASRDATASRGRPPTGSVRVRMYCQGLGDCFLISFPRSGHPDDPFRVLIDCGVILGTPNPGELIVPVVEDILAETKSRGNQDRPTVDLLIATHEHWDHLSGFVQARDLFDQLTVRAVWLGWTEDPKDPVAQQLVAERAKKLEMAKRALASPALRLGSADDDTRSALEALSFFGIDVEQEAGRLGAAGGKAKGAAGGTTADAMKWLKEKSPVYLKPGTLRELNGVDRVRVYVLGPPTDLKKIRKDLPSKGGKETYELSPYDAAQFAAMSNHDSGWTEDDPFVPFDGKYVVPADQVGRAPLFAASYLDPSEEWRRIDGEWLSGIAQFALQLDSDTNNTSLALAFELPGGQVLLFPGDAQVGNWESWHDHTWDVDGAKVVAADLLARTVLYKVGHHGSHNATLSEKGLELMTNPGLVALLPVDEYIAHVKKRWTKMPFNPLLKRLLEKTENRVLRPDQELPTTKADNAFASRVEFATRLIEPEVAPGKTAKRPLYVDYTLDFEKGRKSASP